MRRHVNLSLALILGLVAALSTTPLLAKQYAEITTDMKSDFREGLNITPLGEEHGVNDPPFRAYSVDFDYAAYIPEQTYDNAKAGEADVAMVVKVQSGTFAFRVQSNGIVVDPQGAELEFVTVSPAIPFGTAPMDATPAPSYTLDGPAPGCIAGNFPDKGLCLLDPAKFALGDTYVQLNEGYTVYLPDQSTCFFCNTTELADTEKGDGKAELLVWSSASDFSWYKLYMAPPSTRSDSTPALDQGLHATRAWMFNPGSSCK
jgi:hypothetical protein